MKTKFNPFLKSALLTTAGILYCGAYAHAADISFASSTPLTFTDTQSYDNGTVDRIAGESTGTVVTFDSGANYSFAGNLTLNGAWNRITLNSGAVLNVNGTLGVDVSGVSLNGGTLTAAALQVHDSPDWVGAYWDGKQLVQWGDSVINGSTIIASQSNANFISKAISPVWNDVVGNWLWLNGDGATIDTNGFDIGSTLSMGGGGGLTKTGTGTLTLSAENTYTGGTTVNAGTLEIAGTINGYGFLSGAVTVNSGGTLAITGGDGTGFGWNNSVTSLNINGGTVDADGGSHLGFGAYTTATLKDGGTISGNWQWNGDGLLSFSSSGNTTNTISGNLVLRAQNGTNHTFDVANGEAAVDLLVNANFIEDKIFGESPSSLTKTGTGTMVMTGANTYTGTTTVSQGTLIVNGSISTSITTVQSGATIGGDGELGALTVEAGGFVTPGNSPGVLNTGNYDQAGTLVLEINGTTAGTYDQINVTGTVTLSGDLTTSLGYSPVDEDLLFILLNDGNDAITGAFSGQADNTTFTLNGQDWQISYNADSDLGEFDSATGNDIALRAIPEPGAALLGGLGLLALLRRRR